MVARGFVLRFLGIMPMVYHNIVSLSTGPCSKPDVEATATLATHSVIEQLTANSHCVLSNKREPLLFGIKAIAELVTGICVVPTADFELLPESARIALPRAGYLLTVMAANWYWGHFKLLARAGAADAEPSSQTARICAMHQRIVARNPAAQPPTLFELLGLDPTKTPLWPPQAHSYRGAPSYDAVRRAIIVAFSEQANSDLSNAIAGKRGREASSNGAGRGHGYGHGDTLDEILGDRSTKSVGELASLTRLLLDDTIRTEYMAKFLPALMGSDLRITLTNAKDRKAALENLCPGTYPVAKKEL